MSNSTSIKWCEQLKDVYDYIIEDDEKSLLNLASDSPIVLLTAQNSIWKWMQTYKEDICDSEKSFTKSDKFAFCVGLISEYRNINSWEEVMNSLDSQHEGFDDEQQSGNEMGKLQRKCCCSHDISIYHILKGKKYKAIVGNDCIKKYVIEYNGNVKSKLKKFQAKKRRMKTHKKCLECLKYNIKKDEDEDICYDCLEKQKIYRKCKDCQEYKISKDQPDWKSRCKRCYYMYNLSHGLRRYSH